MNWGQKRTIETTLSMLDETLCGYEEWAKGREIHSVLYHEQNTLSSCQRNVLSSETEVIKEILVELRNTLNLEGQTRIAVKAIRAHCSVLWMNLTELRADNLRRYGKLSPGLSEYLDPQIARLIIQVNKIRLILDAK